VPINVRPGVYSSIDVKSAARGLAGGKTVGVAALAASGAEQTAARILSHDQAKELFGEGSNLTELIRILFLNGAYAVQAVPIVKEEATVQDYAAAFETLIEREDVSIMLCDSTASSVHAALREAILGAGENSKYRIGIIEGTGTVSAVCAAAESLNCERIAMIYTARREELESFAQTAAAVAGALSAPGDPALPINGAELFGTVGAARRFTDSELIALVDAGVTPVELAGEAVSVVRGLTTRTSTGDQRDATWRELTTVLIIDEVVPAVRAALRARFPRVKNTTQTRGAIRTLTTITLENYLKREIIDSYGAVSAQADENDPTACIVSFDFTPAHGLNFIRLSAQITV
jgi:phage tail sheath gpL-like